MAEDYALIAQYNRLEKLLKLGSFDEVKPGALNRIVGTVVQEDTPKEHIPDNVAPEDLIGGKLASSKSLWNGHIPLEFAVEGGTLTASADYRGAEAQRAYGRFLKFVQELEEGTKVDAVIRLIRNPKQTNVIYRMTVGVECFMRGSDSKPLDKLDEYVRREVGLLQ